MKKRIMKLTENDLARIVKRVVKENNESEMMNMRVVSRDYYGLDGEPNGLPKIIQYLQKNVPNHGWGDAYQWITIDAEIVPSWSSIELATTGLTTWKSKWINVKGVDWSQSGVKVNPQRLLKDAIKMGFITKADLNY
jgi:hypothetical protein